MKKTKRQSQVCHKLIDYPFWACFKDCISPPKKMCSLCPPHYQVFKVLVSKQQKHRHVCTHAHIIPGPREAQEYSRFRGELKPHVFCVSLEPRGKVFLKHLNPLFGVLNGSMGLVDLQVDRPRASNWKHCSLTGPPLGWAILVCVCVLICVQVFIHEHCNG